MALRAVLLDLDETLIPEDEPLANAYLAVARELYGAGAGGGEVAGLRPSSGRCGSATRRARTTGAVRT